MAAGAAREKAEVWVVDDDRSTRFVLDKALARAGMRVRAFESGDAALAALGEGGRPDALLCDVRMPGAEDGFGVLSKLAGAGARGGTPVIMMTAYSDLDTTVSAFREGAFEFLAKPLDLDEAVAVAERAVARGAGAKEGAKRPRAGAGAGAGPEAEEAAAPARGARTDDPARAPEPGPPQVASILGSAPALQEVFRAIGRLSRSTATVLVTGESGTGKELVARALHEHGPCAGGPFIAVNTPAVPPDLLESELFGHERGAFTGAHARRRGRFEQADGGTLFLDEIGDMPAELQTRLLRVLADREFYRVGGHEPVRVDVRIVAATHQELGRRVREGRFREDLYHRLNVIGIRLPALRERREDVAALARHFLAEAAKELAVEPKSLRPETVRRLEALPWPGNVRQLENACRWLTVMAAGPEVFPSDLPPELRADGGADGGVGGGHPEERGAAAGSDADGARPPDSTGEGVGGADGARPARDPARDPAGDERGDGGADWEQALARWADERLRRGETRLADTAGPRFERALIEAALRHAGGLRHEAARLLGWGRNTLARKLARGVDSPPPRDRS